METNPAVKRAMNSLRERQWSVISERGSEATGIDYVEAARLMRQLAGEKISGLCIVTDDAAQRFAGVAPKGRNPVAVAANGSNKTAAASKKSTSRRRKPSTNAS